MYTLTTENLNEILLAKNEMDSNFAPLLGFLIYIWSLAFFSIYLIYKTYKFINLPRYIKSKCV